MCIPIYEQNKFLEELQGQIIIDLICHSMSGPIMTVGSLFSQVHMVILYSSDSTGIEST